MILPSLKTSLHKNRRAEGFSLVEVTLALGLVSFALLSVMGLMPVGLSTLRQATDQTAEAQIIQKLSGTLFLTPFSKLAGGTAYYNREGGEESDTSRQIYRVQTSLTNADYPVSGTNAPQATSLLQVQIEVTRVQGVRTTNRFNVYVPNSGN